jgi:nitroreductase
MNPTLELIEARTSCRVFDPAPLTVQEKDAVLHAAFRAPTAGNLMLYSILEIDDPALKARLAVTCDDQPFIAKSPWVLVFLADFQKWIDLFAVSNVGAVVGVEHRSVPGVGDLMLACCDALIAAQNAVVAAESLGIASCYIGDILEQAEIHAELFGLPNHTLPIAMLCLGHPASTRPPTPHYTTHMAHTDTYRRLSRDELGEMSADLEALLASRGLAPGLQNYGQAVYARKFTQPYMSEMNRSVERWIERWSTPEA